RRDTRSKRDWSSDVCSSDLGDSNTYGFDPRGWLGGRYGADNRWVDILARRTGWEILNGGLNGRETPSQTPAFPADTDLLMVMLGDRKSVAEGTSVMLRGRGN